MSIDIDLAVRKSEDGRWIRERIPARVPVAGPDGEPVYELAHSPMFVQGLAADDHVRIDEDGQYELVGRGDNVSVQVFGEWGEVDALAQHVASLRGRLCGKDSNARVFTIPRSAGLYLIETTVDRVLESWPNLSWMFGNVTTVAVSTAIEVDGTPVFEGVQVITQPPTSEHEAVFDVAASPLLVPGLVARDVFTIGEDGVPEVISSGGLTAVQTQGDWDLVFFEPRVMELDGWIDGRAGDEAAVFTFPEGTDRSAIEELFTSHDGEGRSWRFAR